MPWQRLCVSLSADDLPKAEALLRLAGAEAISLGDAEHNDILEPVPGAMPLWPNVVVQALFPMGALADAARSALAGAFQGEMPIQIRRLNDDEWLDTWTQRPAQQPIGERLVLTAAQEEWVDPTRAAVKLNLGLAFGTGDHPTTALCLEWLDANLAAGTRMLDYGCGSAVLAIAALRLGASSAWAVDIDPQALTASRDNAELNEVASRLWIGSPQDLPDVEVDVLIANILAGPLRALAMRFSELVVPGGHIVLSGILTSQSDAVQDAHADYFGSFATRQRGDWVCLSAARL